MSDLIKVTEQDGKKAVSARELHEFLEVKTPFKKWVDRMIESYGFEENVDYLLVVQKCPTNNPKNPWTEITEYE